jgi:hypothetical protein
MSLYIQCRLILELRGWASQRGREVSILAHSMWDSRWTKRTWAGFPRRTSLRHARYSSLHLDTTLYQNDKRKKPGNLQAKQCSVGCWKAREKKNYFHMFKTSENSGWLRLGAVNFTTTHLPNKLILRNIISGVYWKYSANASGRCKDKY